MAMNQSPKIRQNTDTDFLKIVAVISMVLDHVGKVFFPDNVVLSIVGRIAFPLFAYCIVVGFLYTRNIKRYLMRLLVFGVISQLIYPWALRSNSISFPNNLLNLNIFFTLIAGLLILLAIQDLKKRWWLILPVVAVELFIGLDYGVNGLALFVIFYLTRNKRWLSFVLVLAWMCLELPGDFIMLQDFGIDKQFFAILALPFIYVHTNTHLKLNKYIFYAIYPVHLLLIFVFRIVMYG
ncbi:MAG: conjugal transfer protein TraX [Clostridiales Family XIII bacterium]|jgi:hypothetical protein|nr:conjugal transfer protein TraX [Clostridiales Family XIII bacterium]